MNKEFLTYIIPIITTTITVVIGVINIISYRKRNKEKRNDVDNLLRTNKTFYALHQNLLKTTPLNNEEIFKDINNINSEIKILFDKLTLSNCRSTIRVIVYDDAVPMVVTLITQSLKEKSEHQVEFKKTKLFEDTAFSFLISKHKEFYLNNDLTEINSYLPVAPKSNYEINWKLKYLSTLVVPIAKTEKDSNKNLIYGFLCLDSDKKNAFNKEIHVSIARQVSFYLLPLLDSWTKRMIENNNNLIPATETPKINNE